MPGADQDTERLKRILSAVTDGIVVVDRTGTVLYANESATAIFGRALVGRNIGIPLAPLDAHQDIHLVRSGRVGWAELRTAPIEWDGIAAIVGSFRDITERRDAEERARQAAQHDPLTGLANRALIYEAAERVLAGARRGRSCVGFLFFDLDRFKPVNDRHGHSVGDEVLKQVGKRLVSRVRGEDIVGRLGGDEFLVILGHLASPEEAGRIARYALDCVTRPYRVGGREFPLACSVGISVFPRDGDSVDALIRNADAAMYSAKENGRNNVQFFTLELNQRAMEALQIESEMPGSFERGEFELHYQPLVDLRSGEVAGVEALMRWNRPDGRQVGPDRFIPVAESTGFIQTLGDWALHEACRQHKEWQAQGLPAIPVAVNVTALQFRRQGIQHVVSRAIGETGISPEHVQLELTESMVMRDVDEAVAQLDALKSLGLKISLDDFGTGYSSLAYLRRLPVDKLKVDKSFVISACTDENSQLITDAIIGLAHSLKLEVVAEGVESEEALEFITQRGCHQAQGFLISHPLSGGKFPTWFWQREQARGHALS